MPHLSRLLAVGFTAVTTAATTCLIVGPASAAEGSIAVASVSGTKVWFTAAYEGANNVVITRSGRTVTIDDRLRIKPGKGCKGVKGDKTKVRCTTAKTPTRISVQLHRGNDTAVNRTDLPITAYGGEGHDAVTGGPRADLLLGDNGNDRLWGLGGNDRLEGGIGNDVHVGGAGNDAFFGYDGRDTFHGGAGDDVANGGAGNDAFYGDAGQDRASGDRGDDLLRGGAGNDALYGDEGNDKVYGDIGNDDLNGDQGRDRLDGGAGADLLAGDSFRSGALAADVLIGGTGVDEVQYIYTRAITVDLDGVVGDDGVPGEGDTVAADVEGIVGGDGADRLTGNGAANHIDGRSGNDIIRGGAGNDNLDSGEGRDKVYGEAGDDVLSGLEAYADKPVEAQIADLLDGGANGTTGDHCMSSPFDTVTDCERL